jgi:hypothetical protein
MAKGGNLGAFGSGGTFTGFLPADFGAYEKKKWTSNAYTLARRGAKDRLLALGRAIQEELSEELGALEMGASDEAPSVANGRKVTAQWVFFTRDAKARAALKPFLSRTDLTAGAALFDISVQHQHVCLTLKLDNDGLAVNVELAGKATVDRDNVKAKLSMEEGVKGLLELAHNLPGGTALGFEGRLVSGLDLDASHIASFVEGLAGEDTFVVEALIPKDEEALGTEAFIGTAVEYVAELLPALHFFAWTEENNYARLGVTLAQEKKKAKEKEQATLPEIQPGSRVIILSGLFQGRPGYLAEIEKGKAKVMVGPVSVTVDAKDIRSA